MNSYARPPMVAIGASAGGVKALQQFFGQMPPDTGACFVVIVHLDPERESHLPEIIAARTAMRVVAVEETAELRPDSVYVIPPNRQLQMTDHAVSTFGFDEPRARRAPIDLFFRSYAEQHDDGFAVVLTGAGSDGAVGVKAVKEAGGIVLVQDPQNAEYASMPRSAIATGVADIVLPVPQLVDELVKLIRNRSHLEDDGFADADADGLRFVLAYLRARTGHDFSKYKSSTILRHITRRMQLTRCERLGDYNTYIRENADEVQTLFTDLLISVSRFFRDAGAFQVLAERVIPSIFEGKQAGESVRVWVPGCATGEEVYSIAMLLLEEASRRETCPEMQIFASDIDPGALAAAREGSYPAAIEVDVSEERLRRFFIRDGQYYRARRELRDLVLFATHSLLKDPPFTRLDLISCRNLVIYFDRDTQPQVISTFNYALSRGGYLFLGSSESADTPVGLFRSIDRDARIYQSNGRMGLPVLSRTSTSPRIPDWPTPRAVPRSLPSEANLHRGAIENLGPPSILVDEAHQILHISETAGRYLQHPPGPPIADVVELVRPELRMDVRLSLHRAFEQSQTSLSLPVPVRFNGKPQRVYVQVKPVTGQERARTALILFIEGGPAEASTSEGHLSEEGRSANEIIQNLRDELQSSRTRLNASHEEENAAIEELRAANEELQVTNEEYRATAEELETSQEEQRSINEELQTLNHEMKLRLEAVARAHNDLQNLLAVTDVGTLFLDGALRIKGFTSRVTDLFNITVKDEGRPLTDFTHRLIYDGLPADAESVLKSLVPLEREVQNRKNDWFLVRLRPYRTTDDRIEGVVVTFIDVTERRRTELALRDSEDRLLLAKEASDLGVQDYDPKTNEFWWDERARDLWDIKAGETVTADLIWSRIHPDDLQMARSSFDKALDPRGDGVYAAEFRVRGDGKGERWIRANGKAFFSGDGNGRHAARLVATVQDVTQSRSWERRQRLLLSELSHRVGNTLAVVVSMARQTFRRAKDYNQALASFEGRLGALSAAQELLISNDWQGVQLEALARRQLGAEFLENGGRVTFSGPPVLLPADLATPFGLLLHELGTNALTHGSLSRESGTAGLTWHLQPQADGQLLEVEWREAGGAKPDGKFKPGLGSFLIESGLPGAKVTREIHRDGLSCTILLPLERMEPQQ